MLKYNKKYFKILERWNLDKKPLRAINDYSELKAVNRHY